MTWVNIVMLSCSIPKYEPADKNDVKEITDLEELEGLIGL